MSTRPIPAAVPAVSAGADDAPGMMRAITQSSYGPPSEALRLEDLPVPGPQEHEVLVRVHAASIHVGDLVGIQGEPVIARLALGLRRPKARVPGTDAAGTVVAVGTGVVRLRPGDAVFGWGAGAFAEYLCAPEDHFALMPAALSFAQASSIGVSATTALQLLYGRARPGQKVLINGASGGLGSFAVQIAAASGAEVTGVCGPGNTEVVRALGAAHVVDYSQDDFRDTGEHYDFILDNVADRSLSETRRALSADGVLQSNNGTSGGRWFGTLGTVLATAIVSRFTRRQAGPTIKFSTLEDLIAVRGLIEAGAVTPLVGRTYPLSHAADALHHVGAGHAVGTVVLSVDARSTEIPNSATPGADSHSAPE